MIQRWILLGVAMLLLAIGTLAQDSFQQSVVYVIDVELNDRDHTLSGSIRMEYGNNSETTLDTIWMHLWPNGYRDRFSGLCSQKISQNNFDLYFASAEDKGAIDSLDFHVDMKQAQWGYHAEHNDIAWILPHKPLKPGKKIAVDTPFRVKLPSGELSRLGHIDKSYQITQWYPKFAVYDDEGWHTMPYLNQGEFFSEFAFYDVRITLPSNYVVGATGELQTEKELEWLNDLAGKEIATEPSNKVPESSSEKKTIHYLQENVHDFAWFADMRYIVRKGSVTLPRSGREVTTWTMFTPQNAKVWENSIEFLNEATLGYSDWVGEYPYSQISGVDGTISAGGGMEYPMITVIGNASSAYELDIVLSHEAGHNWFYGILASNERDSPWLDEGLNSFIEMQHIGARYSKLGLIDGITKFALGEGAKEKEQGYRYQSEVLYQFQARRGKDQPLHLHSEELTSTNYGAMVYAKSALVFDHLLAYLGKERFQDCMHQYFDTWAFNHPGPKDLRKVFEEVSKEDLSWLFNGLVASDKKYDPVALSIDGNVFSYKIKGNILAPFPVSAWSGDKELGSTWVKPEKANGNFTLPWENVDLVRIDQQQRTLDIDRTNNQVKSSGVFKRGLPLKLKYLAGLERADKEQLFWSLLPSYNTADGFSLGAAMYNTALPSRRTELLVAPLYGTASGNLTGGFRIDHHFDRSSTWTRGLHISLTGRRSGVADTEVWKVDYSKFAFSIGQELAPTQVLKTITAKLAYRGILISEETLLKTEPEGLQDVNEQLYHELSFDVSRRSGINPFTAKLSVLTHPETFVRADLEAEWHIVLNRDQDRLSFRFFGGHFLFSDMMNPRAAYNSAGQTGTDDLLYDGFYAGRAEQQGILAQQFVNNQGGLKTPTRRGGSDTYLLSLGLEFDLPLPLPLVVFAGSAVAPTSSVNGNTGEIVTESQTLYEAGIGLRILRDVFEIWMPLTYSTEIEEEFENQDLPFQERIRFTLDLAKLNPTQLLRKAAP